MSDTNLTVADEGIAQFLDLARSANVFFELVRGRLTIRAVNPNWAMWKPIRQMLDEIGSGSIEAFFQRQALAQQHAVAPPNTLH